MKREIILTADGSSTIRIPEWDECYHSKHGAIQEALHVFIKNGLDILSGPTSILEIGFGTGLNAFITFLEAEKQQRKINYTGVEAFPVTKEEAASLNYISELSAGKFAAHFNLMHDGEWEKELHISNLFTLVKKKVLIQDISFENRFDLIYFDAFGFKVQPELWSTEIFAKLFDALRQKGVLVTYAARGSVKRSLQEVGFSVEKLDGPPGKREMMRAFKG